ncbi:MAG TPA: sporulation protein [Methylotenera sp.]|nr:sporulation protein [Methylotenera sp.]
MKLLVWLLVLLNVGLLVYFNLDLIAPQPAVADRSIMPEKLKILSEEELQAMPVKVAPPVVEVAPVSALGDATTCYKWGNFTKTNLPAAQVVLVRLGLQSEVRQEQANNEDRRFWVYYPPLKNAALAQEKANEIESMGVDELFIVQDSQWRNAISFGLFQDEQLASSLLKELQEKGVKGATKALRSPGKSLNSLLIKSVSAATALELQRIKPEFVGTEIEPAACPA